MRREPPNAAKAMIVRLFCIALLSMLILGEWPGAGGDARAAATEPGGKIVFASDRDDPNHDIYIMNADGSDVERLTENTASDDTPCISPDGRKIAFASRRDGNYEIYIMDADGGNLTNLSNNLANDAQPAFSPDGSRIVFRSFRDGSSGIYIMDVDGDNQDLLITDPGAQLEPTFSPDGSKIAFASLRDGNYEIYIIDVNSKELQRLTNSTTDDLHPTFSPDGSKIAFASLRDGNYEIYVIDVDMDAGVSEPQNITNNLGFDYHPFWGDTDSDGDGVLDARDNCPLTPNPEKIAYSSVREGNYDIYLIDPDGSNEKRLTTNSSPDLDTAISPDGSKIAFVSMRSGRGDIYLMDIDGKNLKQLTNDPNPDFDPSFSPDGSKIIFSSTRTGNAEIFIMNAADGSNQMNLTNDAGDDTDPVFTPDGNRIVFSSLRGGDTEIWIMDANGDNQMPLTNSPGTQYEPDVSPDGRRIVYTVFRDNRGDIFIMDINGQNQTNLTSNPASELGPLFDSEQSPVFSPDGSKIAFMSLREGSFKIFVMNVDGSNPHAISPGFQIDQAPSWGRQADGDHDGIGDACDNNPPSIAPQGVTIERGSSSSFTIATASDSEQTSESLEVTVNGADGATVKGVTVSGISISESGEVVANVSASCSATTATFTLRVTDDGNLFAEAPLTVSVTPNPAPVLGYNNPPALLVGGTTVISPSDGPSDNGGLPSITLQSVTPSSGLSLSVDGSNGNINVTEATKAGTYTAVIRASDQCQSTDASVVIQVICPSITLSDLPNGEVDADYLQTVVPSFEGSYAFSLSIGSLTPGLSLNPTTGVVSGRPGYPGTYRFTIKATHTSGCEATRSYTLVITCPTVTLSDLPNSEAGINYSHTVVPSKEGSYVFSLLLGSLPPGFSLNPTTGVLSGLTRVAGTYQFTVGARQTTGCTATRSYTIVISCPTITLSDLPPFALNAPYNQTVTAAPVTGTYLLELTAGSLPAGLVFNPATGVIGGTPTKTGPYSFTIRATGFGSCSASRTYSGEITAGCPAITLAAIPSGAVGKAFSAMVTASPAGSYSYAFAGGTLPPGVNFYSSSGLLFGYPSAAGEYRFTIRATDVNGCSTDEEYTLMINSK